MADDKTLRLIAEDEADLEVVSAALQDAVAKIGALRYQAKKRRFSVEVNRYRWEDKTKSRARAILGIDSVLNVKARGLTKSDPEMVISILSITFESGDVAPAGTLRILFAGDGELALEVECLDVTLLDGAHIWPTKHQPDHAPRSSKS